MHTNQTQHYGFPLYVGTDIINPLTDFNETNEEIDEALYNANTAAANAVNKANEAKTDVASYDPRITLAETHSSEALTETLATRDMIAKAFDPLKQGGYAIGDCVIYAGKLYEFINPHTGAWDAGDVKVTVITDGVKDTVEEGKAEIEQEVEDAIAVISQQTTKVTATQAMIADPFDPAKVGGYKAGSLVTYADKLYRFNEAHTGAWTGTDVTKVVATDVDMHGSFRYTAGSGQEWGNFLDSFLPYVDASRLTKDSCIVLVDTEFDSYECLRFQENNGDGLHFGNVYYSPNTFQLLFDVITLKSGNSSYVQGGVGDDSTGWMNLSSYEVSDTVELYIIY